MPESNDCGGYVHVFGPAVVGVVMFGGAACVRKCVTVCVDVYAYMNLERKIISFQM